MKGIPAIIILLSISFIIYSHTAFAVTGTEGRAKLRDVNLALLDVVAALAVFLIGIHALRYVTADNPQERADIKKGLTYIIIGLLITYLAAKLVEGIYCYAINQAWGIPMGDCTVFI